MKCRNCSQDNPPEASFCGKCGAKLVTEVEPVVPSAPGPTQLPKKWIPLVGIVAVVAITGIIIGFSLISNDSENTLQTTTTPTITQTTPQTTTTPTATQTTAPQTTTTPTATKTTPQTSVIPTTTVPELLSPADGVVLDNGRTDRLDEIVWDFNWSDVEGATYYHLYVIGPHATKPIIDNSNINISSYHHVRSGSYIVEYNYQGWAWKVRARIGTQWGEWSEIRTFNIEPVNTDPPETIPPPSDTTQITFPDANLEAAIREAINKPEGPIYVGDLEPLTILEANERDISDITGLEYCFNLEVLRIYKNNISDISPLVGLTNLEALDLNSNQISDLLPLSELTNLEWINLGDNNISDMAPLASLTNLYGLSIWGNNIIDLFPLSDLTNLKRLYISQNNISDISPLEGLTNLEILSLWGNNISDISPLASLTNLETLNLYQNNISDISPLVENSGLSTGDTIDLGNNPLSTESINVYIPQLEVRGVIIDY